MRKSNFCSIVSIAVLMIILVGFSAWAVPQLINYQGMLTDGDGYPVTDSALMVHFRICDAQIEGAVLWEESHVLDVQNGIYNVILGSTLEPGTLDPNFFDTDSLWLEVEVDGEPGPMTPRQRLTSVPYALKAEDAETLDGLDSTTLDQSAHVGNTDNPHGVTVAQIGAVSSSGLASHAADPSAHHTKTTSFMDLTDEATDAQIPADITRDSELVAELAGKADSVHTHDERYYTKDEVSDLIIALSDRVAYLESLLQNVTKNGDDITFSGVNVHIVNGHGNTDSKNGLGNLIVGYNESPPWEEDRTGSHNIVTGTQHSYSSWGGLVAGQGNTISGEYATVTAGSFNVAGNTSSSVSGGSANEAEGWNASVSGGYSNTARGSYSSVSGGRNNKASGGFSSVTGGGSEHSHLGNEAFADYSAILGGHDNFTGDLGRLDHTIGELTTVSGGSSNTASGFASSVTGGNHNKASNNQSCVTGGEWNEAAGLNSWVGGGLRNKASVWCASVSGGGDNEAAAFQSSVTGGRNNTASGWFSFVGGGGSEIAAYGNIAYGNYAAVLGGIYNRAGDPASEDPNSGIYSTISGGDTNMTRGNAATVSGGNNNIATGPRSTISGGCSRPELTANCGYDAP
jgi:hypothetical protein